MRDSYLVVATVLVAAILLGPPACSIRGIADGVRDAGTPGVVLDGGASESGVSDGGACGGADLARDGKNCGRCGRVCAGPCVDEVCDVSTIATGQSLLGAIATDGTLVVWTADGENLMSCPVGGCARPTTMNHDNDVTGYVALDGESLLFTTGATGSHGLQKCTLPACADDNAIAFDIGVPSSLAVDQGEIFLLETQGQRVVHCTYAACDRDLAKNTAVDGDIAVGLSNAYWSVLGPPGAIYTCPRSGCPGGTPKPFATNLNAPRALATDHRDVWWTSYEDGIVSSCPLDGCAPEPSVLAKAQKNPLGIVSDGTRVYWANNGDGTVVTCPVDGCDAPEVLVRGLDRPQRLALDSTHVYFTTASGTIGRTPK